MFTPLRKLATGVAVAAIALSGLAFGTSSAYATTAFKTETVADPAANGTITLTKAENDPYTGNRTFKGYHLASLGEVKTKSDDATALASFVVKSDSKYTATVEGANVFGAITDTGKQKTLKQLFEADKAYFDTTNNVNNPLGWLAANYGSVAETSNPWGGDQADGTKSSVLRQFSDKLALALKDTAADNSDFKATATNTGVAQGMWLLVETTDLEDATTASTVGAAVDSAPILVSTTYTLQDDAGTTTTISSNVGSVNLKATFPTIAKEVTNGNTDKNHPDFSIGDEVDYELTATIPSYTGYDIDTTGTEATKARVLKIYDKAEKSLTITADSIASVKVGDTPLAKGTDYTVTTRTVPTTDGDTYSGGTETVIDLANYVNMRAGTTSATTTPAKVDSGKTVTVTVKAKLNENALLSTSTNLRPNKNSTALGYSHLPNKVSDEYKQPGGEVNVYSYKFMLNKQNRNGEKLAGAQFAIKNTSDKYLGYDATNKKWIELNAKPTADAQANAAPVAADLPAKHKAGIFYSDANGNVTGFDGLKAGVYTIEEIASPTDYLNVLLPSFKVTITPTYAADTATKPSTVTSNDNWGDDTLSAVAFTNAADTNALVKANSFAAVAETPADDTNKVDSLTVLNVKNITQLPKTGAAGIAMFIAFGVTVLGAAGFFALRARKAAQLAQ